MGKYDFDDYDDRTTEPTFSLYDFKKWLQKNQNGDGESIQAESIQESLEQNQKDEMKEKFKENFKEKLRKNRKKKD